ncbi:MAG: tail fiber domain-containing protein [Parcubacteria group bacterium]
MKNSSKGKMKKFLNFIVIILLLAGTFGPNGFILPAQAATVGIPSYLGYQGRLKNASGAALSGTYDFSFKLYDASTSGNLLWTENKTMTVTSGYFTTSLGDSTAFGSIVDFTKNLWLDISVAATGVTPLESMTSRVAVNSAAFALAARSIENSASDPATAFGGRMYYNTASGNTYVYDAVNAAWSNVYRSGGADVPVADGGTGASNASQARTNLGLAISTDVQAYDADLTTYAGITPSANIQTLLSSANFTTARSNLGLAINSDVQAYDADLTTYAGITPSANIQSLLGSADYATARTNLGVAIGSNVQAYNAGLADVAGLSTTDSNFVVGNGTNWVAETGATVRTSLGLAISTDVQAYDADLTTYAGITPSANIQSLLGSADYATARTNLGVAIGSNVQAYNAGLADVAGLSTTDSNFVVGNGTNWVAETGATVRTSLGLGSIATQNSDNVTITGGSVSVSTIDGILGLNNGGTGASNATVARQMLGLIISTDVQAYDADLTTYAGITPSANIQTLLGSADFSTARTNLGLGTIATQASDNVTITGGSISGITDLAVADGGTGASNASAAQTNLGLAIGTNVQAYDIELAAIAGLVSATTGLPYFTGNGTATLASLSSFGTSLIDDDNSTVAQSTLGLGTISIQNANNVAITGGAISGITDLAVADGGTGASSWTQYGLLYANATNSFSQITDTTAGKVLITNTGAAPSFSASPTLTGGLTIAPTATGTLLDYQLETEWTSGTLINADFGGATTLAGNVVGMNLDLNTNVTGASNQNATGVYVQTPTLTQALSNTTIYNGDKIGGGNITSSNGTVFWNGSYYVIPNIDQEAGANLLQASGASIGFGTITTAGVMDGLTIGFDSSGPPNGVAAGTLNGIMINQIIPGNGTETALNIGNGWDTGISIGMLSDAALAIDVTNGAVHVADRIGMGTWTADGDIAVYYDTNSSSTNYLGTTVSDIRLKKNIAPLEDNALEIISNVNAYMYNTLDETDGAKKRLGVMAQEIIPYMPELTFNIHQENDDATYYGVHYDKLTVLLLKAIKEQQAQIQSLSLGSSLQGSLTGNISLDNLKVAEHATFGEDTVGRVRILPGATEARVNFAKEYEYQPIVIATLRGESALLSDFKYAVIGESTAGFTIKISAAQNEPIEFNWNAFGASQGKIFVSDGTTENIEIAIGRPAQISALSSSESLSSLPTQSAADNSTAVPAADNSTMTTSSSDNLSAANSEPIVESASAPNIDQLPAIEPAAEPSADAAPAAEPAAREETVSAAESSTLPSAEAAPAVTPAPDQAATASP